MLDIMVLGSGGWGIALALKAFFNGHNVVTLWSPFEEEAKELLKKERKRKIASRN